MLISALAYVKLFLPTPIFILLCRAMALGAVLTGHLTENLATTQNSNGVEELLKKIARILNDVGLFHFSPI
jgi:hypothetical protein